jgi:serine/threonine protein kinase
MRALKVIGRYEILREVGRGGMAMVYLARQSDLDRFVALKELGAFHASDPSFAQRFLRESRVAGSLSHPNIVTVHDYFEHDGTPYIAMEFVERGSLRPYVGQMTFAQIAGVLEGLLAGLTHAESQGIVHRDLKPENLMVTADGRVKIADFGIAKATTRMQTGAFLTATGTTVGTPTYMAPEQAMAQDIGPWTDLYSVGCMAFELFTGNVPFHDSDAPMAILLRHVNEPIPPVKSIVPEVDQRVSDWIQKLLVKDPAQRTQNAQEAWDEFEEIVLALHGPRWRREARLAERSAAEPGDFTSSAWGDTGGDTRAMPAPPPIYTPPPSASAPAPPEPIGGPATPPPSETGTPDSALLRGRLEAAARAGIVLERADDLGAADAAASPAAEPLAAEQPGPVPPPQPATTPQPAPARSAPASRSRPRIARWVVSAVAVGGVFLAGVEIIRWLSGLLVHAVAAGEEPATDVVACTVFAPPAASSEETILVQVFAHLPTEAAAAARIAATLDPTGRVRGYRSLDLPVARGSRLTYELRLPGCQIDTPVESIVWRGATEAVQFLVGVPSLSAPRSFFGTLVASVDGVPAGHVKCRLEARPQLSPQTAQPAGHDARRYMSAFVSYATRDRGEVLRRVQMLRALGIEYFHDVLSLQPGDRWERRIECGLDECDLFLLFWSSAARESVWVRREVEHVLRRKGGPETDADPEIRPVMLEGPPVPEPWEELRSLHFNDQLLYVLNPGGPAPR